jgi:hypothetical protein
MAFNGPIRARAWKSGQVEDFGMIPKLMKMFIQYRYQMMIDLRVIFEEEQ